MIDDGDADDKIIAVPTDDKRWDDVQDISDINKHTLREFVHFFETYKQLKGKPSPVEINGYEGADKAKRRSSAHGRCTRASVEGGK